MTLVTLGVLILELRPDGHFCSTNVPMFSSTIIEFIPASIIIDQNTAKRILLCKRIDTGHVQRAVKPIVSIWKKRFSLLPLSIKMRPAIKNFLLQYLNFCIQAALLFFVTFMGWNHSTRKKSTPFQKALPRMLDLNQQSVPAQSASKLLLLSAIFLQLFSTVQNISHKSWRKRSRMQKWRKRL